MIEYKIITGCEQIIQTKLNQWRHDYDLNIISMHLIGTECIIVLLSRTKKTAIK